MLGHFSLKLDPPLTCQEGSGTPLCTQCIFTCICFQEWSDIKKILVDNATLKHRILVFNHNILTNKNATGSRTLIENIEIKKLYAACPGLVTFYCWVKLNLQMHFQGFKIISLEKAALK